MASASEWISTPHLKLDLRGPVDRPFTPFGDPLQTFPVLDRLRSVVRRQPNAVAIEDERGSFTYAQLWSSVDTLASSIGAQADDAPVGVLLDAGRDYVAAVFACLAAARLVVPLDAGFPAARNRTIAELTGTSLVITHDADATGGWPGVATLPPTLDLPGRKPAAVRPAASADLDAPAFILCTSGSTGNPKPIVHSQRTLLHWARTQIDAMHVTEDDRVLSLSSPSAIGGFVPMIGMLLVGATLNFLDIKSAGIGGLFDALEKSRITILRAAPSLVRGIAQLPEAMTAFADLRMVQTYGEALTNADVGILRRVLPPQCFIRSTYGSTEACGCCWFARPDDLHDPVHTPAGVLMPDTDALIVDDSGAPCRRGEIGELVLRSRYNALGEWQGGRLVPGRLATDAEDNQRRLYRTGDLARCDTDGVFVVLGRKDRMLNINGQRVEPAEVERVIRALAAVRETEVLPFSQNGATTMTAFVVAQGTDTQDLEALVRSALRTSLPSFMVPARIVVLDNIPRLPGGKVDAQALLASIGGRP